jgi:hypothetical protein
MPKLKIGAKKTFWKIIRPLPRLKGVEKTYRYYICHCQDLKVSRKPSDNLLSELNQDIKGVFTFLQKSPL